MTAILVQIDGWDPVAAVAVTLRAASVNDERVCHLDGQTWWPALTGLPALRYDLFDGGFGARIVSPTSALTLAIEAWPDLPRFMLADARLRLWSGEEGAPLSEYVLRFDGRVVAQPAIARGLAAISFGVDDKWLDQPLLATYAGTTGIEGPLALKGQPKPLAIGAPRYVPGQMIDAANSVLQLSAYGAIEEVEQALERLARFGVSFGDYVDYAALVAAPIPAGRWATCRAQGLVRHGAPPAGRLSYLVKGDRAGPDLWVRLPGAVIKRIAQLSGGAGKVSEASVDALDVARPWPVSVYVSAQTTARELIQRIAASVNAVAGVSWTGQLFVVPIAIGIAGLTLDASGAALPPVKLVEQIEVAAPYWKLAIGAEPTWNVHPLSDVAFSAVIVPRGRYVATESYREGHVVDLADGSTWLYVNSAASSGNAPPAGTTGNAFWARTAPPSNVGDLPDAGPFATDPRLPDAVFNPRANLLNNGGFTNRLTRWSNNSWTWSPGSQEGAIVSTSVAGTPILISEPFPVAAGVVYSLQSEMLHQGSGGTVNTDVQWYSDAAGNSAPVNAGARISVNPATDWAKRRIAATAPTGAVSARVRVFGENIAFVSGGVGAARRVKLSRDDIDVPFTDEATSGSLYPDGAAIETLRPQELGANITENRSAAAFAGQGALATRGWARFGLHIRRADDVTLVNDADAITNQGQAASIAGQGRYATRSTVGYGDPDLTGFGALAPRGWARFGLHVRRADDVTLVNDADAITNQGQAASIAGQSAFATDPRSPNAVFDPRANLVNNGGFTLRLTRWSGSNWSWYGGSGEGAYVFTSTAGTTIMVSDPFPVAAGGVYSLQSEMIHQGSGGTVNTDIQWHSDAAGNSAAIGTGTRISGNPATDWTKRRIAAPAPVGAVSARVRVFGEVLAFATGGVAGVRRVKFSREDIDVPFTDEATSGSLYPDGVAIEGLRPQEPGANITENRLAAAVAGQGALATLNDVDFESARVTNKGRVSRLNSTSGYALPNFAANDGRTFSRIAENRASRDGDVVTFATPLSAVPKISFLPGGNAATAGQNIQIIASGLTVSGFTMKAKSQAVTAGATITDTTAVAPGAGEPSKIVDRSNGNAPFDGKFRFTVTVTVGTVAPGEPGSIVVAIYVKQAAAWVQVGTGSRTSSGTIVVDVTPGAVDFGTGGEFGASVSSADGSGTALNSLDSVVYTLGTVTETSLTPAGASDVPWLAMIQ